QKLDYDRMMEMYKQLFSNPGSFTFTLVGNINEDEVKPVIERYLASLPAKSEKADFVKVPMNFVEGNSENIFRREMLNPKASVFNSITGNLKRDMQNQILRSEEHTSELQSRENLVCRLLL